MTTSACGPYLDRCRCRSTCTDVPRSRAEMEARHREAVRRAARSDGRLSPADAGNGPQKSAQTAARVTLDELAAATLAQIERKRAA